jgi:DNA-binding XRE family transcriptional regulator
MDALAKLLDLDPDDPEVRRARFLAEEDYQLLRKLVELRKRSGVTQATVAERLGITQPSVAAFERYDSDPKLSTIRRYAQVVGLLVGHKVEVDNGQRMVAGGSWAGGWVPTPAAHFNPSTPNSLPPLSQKPLSLADSNRSDFVIAA